MDIRLLRKNELIVLCEDEIEEQKIDRCFREYRDMANSNNTIFVINNKGIFIGIITLYDYLNYLETSRLINKNCKKIIADNEDDALSYGWKLKQEFDSLKIIPVVNTKGFFSYGIRVNDNEKTEKNIRDFDFWFRHNKRSLISKYRDSDTVCVVGREPFFVVYVAKLLKEYFKYVSILIIGEKEWIFREKDVLGEICVEKLCNLNDYMNLISVDFELYGFQSTSIKALSDFMSEYGIEEPECREEKRDVIWLHIGDLLTPLEGKLTAVQLFIISRIIDIERRKDGMSFYWQNRFNEFFWPEMSKNQEETMEFKVDLLINSIKRRGFDPNTSAGSVTEYPFGMNDGAHRTAYHAVYSPNSFLPYFIGNGSLTNSFWPHNGEEFFEKAGLPIDELEKLKNRYLKFLTYLKKRSVTMVL